jgi:hypothetical protein
VAGGSGQEGELVRPEAKGGTHGRVDPAERAPRKRFDGVVERPHALHRAVGDLLREGPIARVKT